MVVSNWSRVEMSICPGVKIPSLDGGMDWTTLHGILHEELPPSTDRCQVLK